MSSVFISYQQKPSAVLAALIAQELRKRDIDVYLDTQRRDSAEAFPEALKDGIRSSDVFVCLVGATTFESEWVQAEIHAALELGKAMIPVFQESYQQGQPAPTSAVNALLERDGILIFDEQNVHIEQSVDMLARMIENATAEVQAASSAATPATAVPSLSLSELAGHRLGQYQLRTLLGMGGMGAVYRAYQPSLNRDVAVKVLAPALATDEGYARRFVREAQTSAALEHAHIVPVHDYGSDQGFNYVVMRLLTGGSLADRMEHQQAAHLPLPSLAEIADVLHKLAAALDYGHSRGVIHRDIKANNVMFDDQGTPFVVDFGIAKLTGATTALTLTGMVMGTPSYMAPEQWRGESVTAATDQYALGVLAYGMLTGRMPFEASTPYALMHQHLNDTPPSPDQWRDDVPEALQAVINRAMAKEPADRYPSILDFARAFDEAIGADSAPVTGFFTAALPQKPPPLVVTTEKFVPARPTFVPGPVQTETTEAAATRSPLRNPITWAAAAAVIVVGLLVIALVGGQPGGFLAAAPTITLSATPLPTITLSATPLPTDMPTDTPIAASAPTLLPTQTMIPPTATVIAAVILPTTVPTVPTVTSSPPPVNVLLLYDNVSFTLHNRSGQTLSLEGVMFRSAHGTWDARNWGPSLYVSLPDNNCLRLRDASTGNRQPPSVCGNLYGLQLVGTSALFWLNTDSFDVVRNGAVIATCPTDHESCGVHIP